MRMKDEEIQQKLLDLENAILREQKGDIAPLNKGSELSEPSRDVLSTVKAHGHSSQSTPSKSDLHYFGGIALILFGLFLLLQHVKLTSGYVSWWGVTPGSSIGFLMVPLLIGIGWIFYNSRSIWGWLTMVVSLAVIVFTVISGLRMYFVPLSMLNVIFMLIPLAVGVAYVIKGMGGPQGIDATIRQHRQLEKKD